MFSLGVWVDLTKRQLTLGWGTPQWAAWCVGCASGGWFGTWDLPRLKLRHRSWALRPGTSTMRLVTGITLLLALGKWSGPKKEWLSWLKTKTGVCCFHWSHCALPNYREECASLCFYVSVCLSRDPDHHCERLSHPLLTEDLLSLSFQTVRSMGLHWTQGSQKTTIYLWLCGSK